MARIRIVTDATAHIRPELVEQHRITVLPVEIYIGEVCFPVAYGDPGIRRRICEGLAATPSAQTQAGVRNSLIEQTLERLSQETDEILVILSSGRLSSGLARAQAAARTYVGRCRVTVIDSLSSSWGLGLVVESAAKAADQGASLDAIIRLIRGLLPHIYAVFFVERLDFLQGKGRIGMAQALLGAMLRIRPILLLEDGEIIPMEKVRTRALAIEKLADFVAEFAAVQRVVILRSPLEDSTEEILSELRTLLGEVLPRRQFPVIEYDPVLACHLGPQATGVIVYERG